MKFRLLKKYIIAALILIIPLYQKFPLVPLPGTYVSIRMEDFVILISLLYFIIFFRDEIKDFIKDKMFYAITFFFAAGMLSLLYSVLNTHSVDLNLGLLHWIRRVEYLSMFFIGYSALKKDFNDLPFYTKLIPLVIFIAFIYGFGQKYFHWPIIITQNQEYAKGIALRYVDGSHINSTFAGHYDLATYLVFVLPLILVLIISFNKINLTFFVVYISGLWLLVNTASRISLLSFIVAASVTLFTLKQFRKGFLLILLSILFIGFSSNLIGRYERVIQIFSGVVRKYVLIVQPVNAQESVITRREISVPTPTPIPVFEDRSTSIRLNVEWPRALRALSKNPLLGTGYSSITLATDNDYLRLLGETGVLGTSSFLYVFASMLYPICKYLRKMKTENHLELIFVASVAGGLAGVLMNAFFIDVFEASKFALIFWLFLGMTYSIAISGTELSDK